MSISTKDYNSVKSTIDFLDNVKRYVPSAGISSTNSEEANEVGSFVYIYKKGIPQYCSNFNSGQKGRI
jgi:hypothetical protein